MSAPRLDLFPSANVHPPPPYVSSEEYELQINTRVPVLHEPEVPHWNASPIEARKYLTLFWLHKTKSRDFEEATNQVSKFPIYTNGRSIHTLSIEYLREIWGGAGNDLHTALYYSQWGYVCSTNSTFCPCLLCFGDISGSLGLTLLIWSL